MDLTQHDMDELRQAAWKAQATSSPHARVTVPVEASTLLWLLQEAEVTTRAAKEAAASYEAETEQTIREQDEEIQKLQEQIAKLSAPGT